MISFPDLTPAVHDPEPLLHFYERLASELRRRQMKFLIECFVYPPVPTSAGKYVMSLKNLPDPQAAYFKARKQEVKLLLSRLQPDYLTLISEPGTYDHFLGFSISAQDNARWLQELIADLPQKTGHKTLLGAGAGVWEPEEYVQAFAQVKGLDYIDLHFYPLKLHSEDLLAQLLHEIEQVKATDPAKPCLLSETWLYKHGAEEPKGVFNKEAYGRNAYAFWTPLDIRFLKLMQALGRKEGLTLVAPYFPQYFFVQEAYDPEHPKDWPASLMPEWQRAIEAMQQREHSPLGQAFKAITRRL